MTKTSLENMNPLTGLARLVAQWLEHPTSTFTGLSPLGSQMFSDPASWYLNLHKKLSDHQQA